MHSPRELPIKRDSRELSPRELPEDLVTRKDLPMPSYKLLSEALQRDVYRLRSQLSAAADALLQAIQAISQWQTIRK